MAKAKSAREVAEEHGWVCVHGCPNLNGVYPGRYIRPTHCPECHEAFHRKYQHSLGMYTALKWMQSPDSDSTLPPSGRQHVVDYRDMRTATKIQKMSASEAKATRKLERQIGVKSLSRLMSELRGMRQKLAAERRAAGARDGNWEDELLS